MTGALVSVAAVVVAAVVVAVVAVAVAVVAAAVVVIPVVVDDVVLWKKFLPEINVTKRALLSSRLFLKLQVDKNKIKTSIITALRSFAKQLWRSQG